WRSACCPCASSPATALSCRHRSGFPARNPKRTALCRCPHLREQRRPRATLRNQYPAQSCASLLLESSSDTPEHQPPLEAARLAPETCETHVDESRHVAICDMEHAISLGPPRQK